MSTPGQTTLQRVAARLAKRSDRLNAAEWSQAIKAVGEQIDEELSSDLNGSETLGVIEASRSRAYRRRKAKENG
jgi:hypothetical protein